MFVCAHVRWCSWEGWDLEVEGGQVSVVDGTVVLRASICETEWEENQTVWLGKQPHKQAAPTLILREVGKQEVSSSELIHKSNFSVKNTEEENKNLQIFNSAS